MDQDQVRAIYSEYFYYILAADIVIGLLFGLAPLILGIKRKTPVLGYVGLVVSGLLGVFSPLLSIVSTVIFVVLILRRHPAAVDTEAGIPNEDH